MSERLLRITLKDGTYIDFNREENKCVKICKEGHCAIIPRATGQVTLDLISLIEPFGEIVDEGEDEDDE